MVSRANIVSDKGGVAEANAGPVGILTAFKSVYGTRAFFTGRHPQGSDARWLQAAAIVAQLVRQVL
jgi:hypothetical protein